MKLSSPAETAKWLETRNFTISRNRDLIAHDTAERSTSLIAELPREVLKITYLANDLSEFISNDEHSLLWLKNWETTPAYEVEFFERARSAPMVSRLIDNPGHIFLGGAPTSTNDRKLLAGLILLIMAFDWEAYLVSESTDLVYLSDQHIMFSCRTWARHKLALEVLGNYGLSPKASK